MKIISVKDYNNGDILSAGCGSDSEVEAVIEHNGVMYRCYLQLPNDQDSQHSFLDADGLPFSDDEIDNLEIDASWLLNEAANLVEEYLNKEGVK